MPTPPVRRDTLFQSPLVEVRDNRCNRDDPALSAETAPLGFCEVTFARSGLWLRHCRGRPLPVDSNHVHFFACDDSHRVSHPIGCGDRNTGIVLRPDTLRDVLRSLTVRDCDAARFPATHVLANAPLSLGHQRLLQGTRHAERTDPLAVEEQALALVALAIQHARQAPRAADPALTPAQRDLAEAARALLHQDLDQPLHLGTVAAALQVSPFHLARLFRRHVGLPLHAYRLQLRLRLALEHLVTRREPLARVAAATGFADRMHLTHQFVRAFGIAPSQLRR